MIKSALYVTGFLLSIVVLSANVRLSGYIARGVEGIEVGDTGVLVVDTYDNGFSGLTEIFSAKPNQILQSKEDYDFASTGYQPIASHVAALDFPGSAFASIILGGGASFNIAPLGGSNISSGDEFALVVFTNSNTSGNDVLIFSEADWLVPSDGSLSTYSNDLTQLNDISVPSQTYSYSVGGAWHSDAAVLADNWRYNDWLGYFNIGTDPWIYHMQHGWLYVFPSVTDTESVYFWDNSMQSVLWTSQAVYPSMYRFSDSTWIWYQKDSSNPRFFNKLATGEWENW